MSIFDVFSLMGGLALFLFGMNAMGDGLAKLSGGKLERILEKFTNKPIKGVLLGALVTAVIQSSSATTVMVVGFVNSGIMKLTQAVSIIMGANIGTTITSWVLSLAGLEGDSIWIKLLKPSSFAPVLAFVGIVFYMFTKSQKKKDVGTILLGFAILMTGMDSMSAAVKPLASNESFTSILTMFSNPVLGMLAGAVLTAVIQSSSASVGILQALCISGVIKFGTAFPIIMGQNIGTCVTAIISGVGASKNAKRAAFVHLYFNIIGTTVFMIVFYILNAIIGFEFMDSLADASGIATIHTAFNVTATLLLLPFSKQLEKLATFTIRDKADSKKSDENISADFLRLDERFLEKPAFAIEQCKTVAARMAENAQEALVKATGLINVYDEEIAAEIIELEDKVDRYEDEIGSYLIKLSSRNLSEEDSRTLSELLHCIGDFERISDHAVNIGMTAKEIFDKKITFSEKAFNEIKVFTGAVLDVLETSVRVFKTKDLELAKTVEPLEEVVDDLNTEMKARHVRRLREGKCTIEMGFILTDLTTNFERVADHCSNIALCLIEVQDNEFETHEYINKLDKGENTFFRKKYLEYRDKYSI